MGQEEVEREKQKQRKIWFWRIRNSAASHHNGKHGMTYRG